MRKHIVHIVLVFLVVYICAACDKVENGIGSSVIEGLTIDNYPNVDGSTSTAPLNTIIACKLLDVKYKWVLEYSNIQGVLPELSTKNSNKLKERIKSSQTHRSFLNLIAKEADLILSARTMSADEKAIADVAGVDLVETPVALDAFIFIIHPDNPVRSLTHEQVREIYTGKITNWKEVGGNDAEIKPYVRNANSGSQELMEELVMKGLEPQEFPVSEHELMAFSMTGAFEVVDSDPNAICYTVFYYKEHIISETPLRSISINGIYPDKKSISDRTYPYVAEVYAIVRKDLERSSMAYTIYEWLQTGAGKETISESGYAPY